MDIDFDACLRCGSNYEMGDGLVIRNHQLNEIYKKIKLSKYYNAISVIILDKEKIMSNGYTEAETDYYILCITIDFLEMFIECKEVKYHTGKSEYMVYLNDDEFVWLDKNKLNNIFSLVKMMYCVPETSDRDDDITFDNDEVAKKFADFFEAEKEMKEEEKDFITIDSIIEYVSNKHPSLNMYNIWNLTMWQLQRSYVRLELIDGYNTTITGIYAGTIDSKNINLKKIRADKFIK